MKKTEPNSSKPRVFITGIGVISAIGNNLNECHDSLKSGRSGIARAQFFNSKYRDLIYFGEVALSDDDLKISCNAAEESAYTRTTLLALRAFDEAVGDAQLTRDALRSFRTGFISSSTVGGMCYTDELYKDANKKSEPSNFIRSYEGSDHTLRIIERYGMRGYSDTLNTACSSSANALLLGARLIQSGKLDRVIVGGSDSLAKYTVNGFNSLMILSEEPCRPFDQNRDGLTLGEGAAYLVLESEQICGNKQVYGEVAGAGNSNDAFHPSATSDDARGPVLAMKEAIREACITPDEVDYINAHGTGTPNNDVTESFAFSQVFDRVPPYNSTKSYTGHTLAAAGAMELVFSLLSMKYSELYPSLRCNSPIADFEFSPIDNYYKTDQLNYIMSNSFGFGGNCTSVILKNVHR